MIDPKTWADLEALRMGLVEARANMPATYGPEPRRKPTLLDRIELRARRKRARQARRKGRA